MTALKINKDSPCAQRCAGDGTRNLVIDTETREIMRDIQKREIKHFVHFTLVDNLVSILEEGLQPRNQLRDGSLTTDSQRLDNWNNSICLSVSFPNYLMLYKKQQDPRWNQHGWCVVLLNPAVVVSLHPRFYASNAASSNARNTGGYTVKSMATMFDDTVGEYTRSEKTKSYWTTDPQAELQVDEAIPSSAIQAVAFSRQEDWKRYWALLNNQNIKAWSPSVKLGAFFFRPRPDCL